MSERVKLVLMIFACPAALILGFGLPSVFLEWLLQSLGA